MASTSYLNVSIRKVARPAAKGLKAQLSADNHSPTKQPLPSVQPLLLATPRCLSMQQRRWLMTTSRGCAAAAEVERMIDDDMAMGGGAEEEGARPGTSHQPNILCNFDGAYHDDTISDEDLLNCYEELSANRLEEWKEFFGIHASLDKSVLKKYDLRAFRETESGSLALVMPLYELDAVGSQRRGHRVRTRERRGKKQARQSTGPRKSIFPIRKMLPNDRHHVVLCAQLNDALVVDQYGHMPAIELLDGVLDEGNVKQLEQLDRITIWFPAEDVYRDKVQQCVQALGAERCYIVSSILSGITSPSACLSGCNEAQRSRLVCKALKEAVHAPVPDVLHPSAIREAVFNEFVNPKFGFGVQFRRLAPLNKILRGFRRGELTVFTGPTGAGKTTFLSEYTIDLAEQGIRTLWGSFEIPNRRLLKNLYTQYLSRDLSAELRNDPDAWSNVAEVCERLPITLMSFFGATDSAKVTESIRRAVLVSDTQHVVIDNLQFMQGARFSDMADRFLQQDRMVSRLRQLCNDLNVHITLVIHPKKEPDGQPLSIASIYGGVQAGQEADNIMILQSLVTETPPYYSKSIDIKKNRYSGDVGRIPLRFHKDVLRFSMASRDLVVPKVEGRLDHNSIPHHISGPTHATDDKASMFSQISNLL